MPEFVWFFSNLSGTLEKKHLGSDCHKQQGHFKKYLLVPPITFLFSSACLCLASSFLFWINSLWRFCCSNKLSILLPSSGSCKKMVWSYEWYCNITKIKATYYSDSVFEAFFPIMVVESTLLNVVLHYNITLLQVHGMYREVYKKKDYLQLQLFPYPHSSRVEGK